MRLSLLALTVAASPALAGGFDIITPGQHHGGVVERVSGKSWLGLFATDLRPVKLTTKAVRDPVDDDGKPPSVMTGLELSSDTKEQPRFLMRGLRAGAVKPLPAAEGRFLGDMTPSELQFDSVRATLLAERTGPTGTRLVLRVGEVKQTLYEQKEGDTEGWSLLWAGDLDGDGLLDLVLSADHHYNTSTLRLFLSSHAKKGQLVREVATFTELGC